ncbi:PPOX class F420-dependent oxidoreductase [Conexibacter woesei]|uniref:PPOX class F420-dependent oxidoreductase n=1 Tax=Conexibacter woesei TaxID=191495 RepID=UPI000414C6F9|nr:PPOX class F420-dependent oxidoreductase [Conexibacter woesei]
MTTTMTTEARALLEAPNLAHLATTLPDGAPHVVPVWVGVDDADRIVFLTGPDSVKGRNIERDPRVALSLTAADAPNTMLHVRGVVTDIRDDDAGWAIIDALAEKYLGGPYPLRSGRAAYVIAPERVVTQSF